MIHLINPEIIYICLIKSFIHFPIITFICLSIYLFIFHFCRFGFFIFLPTNKRQSCADLFKTHLSFSLCFPPAFKLWWCWKSDQGWLPFPVIERPSIKEVSTGWSVRPSHPFLNFGFSTIFTTLGSFYALLSSIGFLSATIPISLTSSHLLSSFAWLIHQNRPLPDLTHTHTGKRATVFSPRAPL